MDNVQFANAVLQAVSSLQSVRLEALFGRPEDTITGVYVHPQYDTRLVAMCCGVFPSPIQARGYVKGYLKLHSPATEYLLITVGEGAHYGVTVL